MSVDYELAFPTPEAQQAALDAYIQANIGYGGGKPYDTRQFYRCPFRGDVAGYEIPYDRARELVTAANEERTERRDLEQPSPVSEAEVVLLAALLFYGENPLLQHPVGPYDLDFLIDDYRAAIEVDGRQHLNRNQARKDKRRDQYVLERTGIRTYRVPARDVFKDPLWTVRYTCREISLDTLRGL